MSRRFKGKWEMLSYLGTVTAIEHSKEFAHLMPCCKEGCHCSVQLLKGMLTAEPGEARPHNFDTVPVVPMPHRHAKEVLHDVA